MQRDKRSKMFVLCLVMAFAVEPAKGQYILVDLGTLEGSSSSTAYGLNEFGEVVGESGEAVLWSGGEMRPLGTLGGERSVAYGINGSGWIVGTSETDDRSRRGFLFRDGEMLDLGTLGGQSSIGLAINDGGEIVGYSYLPSGNVEHAFLWREGAMRDLGTLGGLFSRAADVNDAGQVVGQAVTKGRDWHAFLWHESTGMVDLLPDDGLFSQADAINSLGQVVGLRHDSESSRIFIWQNGVVRDLDPIPDARQTWVNDINDHSMIVGRYRVNCLSERAFLYVGDQRADLDEMLVDGMGWNLTEARAIDNEGRIVGWGWNEQYRRRAFLLLPPDCNDADLDTRCDVQDNCPAAWNFDQLDTDADGLGDVCDADDDDDQVLDDADNCPLIPNPSQRDTDDNGIGDACEPEIPRFSITNLGTFTGEGYSSAFGINNHGEVVGRANSRAFLWQGGELIDLNDLIDPNSGWNLNMAQDINDNGQIAGDTPTPDPIGFRLTPGDPYQIDSLAPMRGDGAYGGFRINNPGQVVGFAATPNDGPNHAFLWDEGDLIDLGTLGGERSRAYDINDIGEIAGYSVLKLSRASAFWWSEGELHELPSPDPDQFTFARGLNDTGWVVGSSSIPEGGPAAFGSGVACIWIDKRPTLLGTLGGQHSTSFAVNDDGWVIGISETDPCRPFEELEPFLWLDGRMHSLNDLVDPDLGWDFWRAYDINNAGQIVGVGTVNDQTRAYVMTPEYVPTQADFNLDGRVNLLDYEILIDCLAGPGVEDVPEGCDPPDSRRADFNGDGSVDLHDFVRMQADFRP